MSSHIFLHSFLGGINSSFSMVASLLADPLTLAGPCSREWDVIWTHQVNSVRCEMEVPG
jgi:hypothetical protein